MKGLGYAILGAAFALVSWNVVSSVYAQVPVETPTAGASLGGSATADIDMAGFAVKDTTQALDVGAACTTSHSLVAGDVCIGGTSELEVDGMLWCDAGATFGDDIDMGNNYITGPAGIRFFQNTTDVDENTYGIHGIDQWAQSVTNLNGGNLAIVAGNGPTRINVSDYSVGSTDTVTFNWSGPDVGIGGTITFTEGTDWDCITDNDTCVTNLATAINGTIDSQGEDDCTFIAVGDTSTDKVEVYVYNGCYLEDTGAIVDGGVDGAFATFTQGGGGNALGSIWFGASNILLNDSDTGFSTATPGTVTVKVNNSTELTLTTTNATFGTNVNVSNSGDYFRNSAACTQVGGAVTSTHSLAANDVCVKDELEVDNTAHFDADVKVYGAKGQNSTIQIRTEALTFAGGGGDASKTTTVTLIPGGSILLGVTSRVNTAGTTCDAFNIGISGGDVDLFGADISSAQNTTSDNQSTTATWSIPFSTSDQEVIVTGRQAGVGAANCVNMVITVTAHIIDVTAPTSN